MAYKCVECGHIFENGEEDRWMESLGEFWGTPCSEEVSGCPLCHGGYEETKKCSICGSEEWEDDLHGQAGNDLCACDECIQKYAFNAEMCYKIGQKSTVSIEINSFLSTIFTEKEINDILYREMKIIDKYALINGSKFIDDDIDWFAGELAKEVNEE